MIQYKYYTPELTLLFLYLCWFFEDNLSLFMKCSDYSAEGGVGVTMNVSVLGGVGERWRGVVGVM